MKTAKGRLSVEIPEPSGKSGGKEAWLQIHSDWEGGSKAAYLAQTVASVPPVRWEMHFDLEPAGVLSLFEETDWSGILLEACARAAAFQEDDKWIAAILEYFFEDDQSVLWNKPVGQDLLEMAPASVVNHLSKDYLERINGLPGDDTPVFQLWQLNDARWSEELSLMVVKRLQKWLSGTSNMDWRSFHYRDFPGMIALRTPSSLIDVILQGWTPNYAVWHQWEKPVQDMFDTLRFRKEMISELET